MTAACNGGIKSGMQRPLHQSVTPAAAAPHRFAVKGTWCAELLPRKPYQTAYTPEAAVIGFAFESQVGMHAFGSDRRVAFRARPNGLAYVPPGCDVYSCSVNGGEYLRIACGEGSAIRENASVASAMQSMLLPLPRRTTCVASFWSVIATRFSASGASWHLPNAWLVS